MYRRYIEGQLRDSLSDTPVVLLHGARQTGKTTLAKGLAGSLPGMEYVTLDDISTLAAAKNDPVGFIRALPGRAVLDEVQLAPELFPAIKLEVDANRQPGRFLLTGSASVLMLPRVSESLAGRMEIHTLWPLAQTEIEGTSGNLVDSIFDESLSLHPPAVSRADLHRRLITGGYPEPLSRPAAARRRAWFRAYVTTILRRDVRDLAQIEGMAELPRLLESLAARASSLLNQADISRDARLPYTTLSRYMALLEACFLVRLLPAWSSNRALRLAKSPKLLINDSGLLASLLGIDESALNAGHSAVGSLLENFCALEAIKLASWSRTQPGLFHYRTLSRQEVDLILEEPGGRVAGIEVKAASTVTSSDFRGLRSLQEQAGAFFHRGIVLYAGDRLLPFGPRLEAVPISALWSG